MVSFIHYPKTGGSTIKAQLQEAGVLRIYEPSHSPFSSVRSRYPGDKYVTFLRDPVDREVSLFHFQKGFEEHKRNAGYGELDEVERMKVAAAARGWDHYLDNGFVSDFRLTYFYTTKVTPNGHENLKTRFSFVGLFERFEQDSALLMEALGLPPAEPRHENAQEYEQPSQEIKDRIASKLPKDMEFYHRARQLFL